MGDTFYESDQLQIILDRIIALTIQGRSGDADSLADEFGLREWLCEV